MGDAKKATKELAAIRPFKFSDQVTGNKISISVSHLYSKLRINNREYFFVRETGEFDGTGTDLTEAA